MARRRVDRPGAQRGMTLIELLVAMSISLVITAMILLSWFALSGSYANTVRREEASDSARFALARMEREIRDAEQPPSTSSEVAVVRARPYYIELYTTFNEPGNQFADVKPRLVMYRLYSNGELWRFQDADNSGSIKNVNDTAESWPSITFSLAERTSGEGAQLMASNVVNATTPSATSPTALFTYISYNADGTLARQNDVRGTDNRAQILAVEINLLLDLNPGKSPVYTHLRTTAQLRNTR
jgi:prepilin-type N-terminal cleavage/methylation domain-containing protein